MSEENNTQPQGKGLAIGGFILSLVGLIFTSIVMGIVMANMLTGGGKGLAYFWVVLCAASVVLSVMGMMKLGKTGGKKGLAIAGMIIGIVATIWAILALLGLSAMEGIANEAMGEGFEELGNALDQLENLQ